MTHTCTTHPNHRCAACDELLAEEYLRTGATPPPRRMTRDDWFLAAGVCAVVVVFLLIRWLEW